MKRRELWNIYASIYSEKNSGIIKAIKLIHIKINEIGSNQDERICNTGEHKLCRNKADTD